MATKPAPRKKTTKPPAHPLENLIPEEMFLDTYISRDIAGIRDLDILDAAFDQRHNVLVFGPTGSAKTSLVYAFGAMKNLPVVNVPCNGAAEPRQLIGGWTPQPDGTFDFVPGDLLKAVMHGGIIYLDEVNMTPPKILSILHGLLDRRRTITVNDAEGSDTPTSITAHPECFVMAAYNPGYQGTRPLNEAFKNRFAFRLEFPYSEEVERELISSPTLISVGRELRGAYDSMVIRTPVSTNSLIEFEDFALDERLGYDFALHNFVAGFEAEDHQAVISTFEMYEAAIKADLYELEADTEEEEV